MFEKEKFYVTMEDNQEVDINKFSLIELSLIEYLSAGMIYTGKEIKENFKLFSIDKLKDDGEYEVIIIRKEIYDYTNKKIKEWENGILS